MAVRQFKKIAIGCDHAGYPAKAGIIDFLQKRKCKIIDVGCPNKESCDYPVFAFRAAEKIFYEEAEAAILICGTGLGMNMASGKFSGLRSAMVYNDDVAKFSRQHNNANVLCLGARQFEIETLIRFVKIWLTTEYEGGRHQERLRMIRDIENSM